MVPDRAKTPFGISHIGLWKLPLRLGLPDQIAAFGGQMANWSKRRSWKSGSAGQRTTKTTSNTGKTTRSTSYKSGSTRITESIPSSGKTRVYITEHHPTLGTKRTVRTINPTKKVKQAKRPRASKKSAGSKFTYVSAKAALARTGPRQIRPASPPSPLMVWLRGVRLWWWPLGLTMIAIGAPWFAWMGVVSLFMMLEIPFFSWRR